MTIKQLSVFVENKKGKLAQIMQILAQNGVDIRALSLADTTDYGILRMIVNDTAKAVAALQAEHCVVSVNEVLGVAVDDTPGGFAAAVQALSDNEVNLEYVYAFITPQKGYAYVVMRVTDNDAATKILQNAGVKVLDDEELHAMFR
ncbi:MAG: acetolactate synthase [Ruminococcaceae bacterium]|nr:acetolactate synthase [Oscillospiraceae bacterium]